MSDIISIAYEGGFFNMILNLFYFVVSFLGDALAYIFYQQYVQSHKKDTIALVYAIISAFFVWFFIFKLQDRGQILRIFLPAWSSGTAVFGYFAGGLATGTPTRELFNPVALVSIAAIGLGIYFLARISS